MKVRPFLYFHVKWHSMPSWIKTKTGIRHVPLLIQTHPLINLLGRRKKRWKTIRERDIDGGRMNYIDAEYFSASGLQCRPWHSQGSAMQRKVQSITSSSERCYASGGEGWRRAAGEKSLQEAPPCNLHSERAQRSKTQTLLPWALAKEDAKPNGHFDASKTLFGQLP